MPYKNLRIETRNRVGYILLDAGSRFNKLSITTIRELKRAFTQVGEDVSTSAIVLSGYPGESFAVGPTSAKWYISLRVTLSTLQNWANRYSTRLSPAPNR